jgi:hypothetical protein
MVDPAPGHPRSSGAHAARLRIDIKILDLRFDHRAARQTVMGAAMGGGNVDSHKVPKKDGN